MKIRIEKNKVPVEDGEPGEIVILGDSVAAGYVLEDPSHAFGRIGRKKKLSYRRHRLDAERSFVLRGTM